jgi:hypothetical protein
VHYFAEGEEKAWSRYGRSVHEEETLTHIVTYTYGLSLYAGRWSSTVPIVVVDTVGPYMTFTKLKFQCAATPMLHTLK